MREIKFRGKSIRDGKWYYGYFLVNSFGEYTICGKDFAVQIAGETAGEFTGLKDSNGQEIYEGDIISGYLTLDNGDNYDFMDKVSYYGYKFHCENSADFDLDMYDLFTIGNIYENPELLEGAQ
jgi:uncharacterized phage protein (TIGR01671 family)